ncbi:hypothetical protein D3C72_774280 [compost metagenome]
MASPMIVERKWPTCKRLATFGLENSTTTVCGFATTPTPPRGSLATWATNWPRNSLESRMLMKPGPAMVGGSAMPLKSSLAMRASATSRGFFLSDLASGMAALDW